MFAKLIDEITIEPAGDTLEYNGMLYTGLIPREVLLAAGYLEEIPSDPVDYNPTYQKCTVKYVQVDAEHFKREYTAEYLPVEHLIEVKRVELNEACKNTIHGGFDLQTSVGLEHYDLTPDDQVVIDNMAMKLMLGQKYFTYHSSRNGATNPCRVYTVAEVTALVKKAEAHITYNLTYCNLLKTHLESLTDPAEISAITYGMELPAALKNRLNELLAGYTDVY